MGGGAGLRPQSGSGFMAHSRIGSEGGGPVEVAFLCGLGNFGGWVLSARRGVGLGHSLASLGSGRYFEEKPQPKANMSIFAHKDLQSFDLDRRYFAAFVIFQGLMVLGGILYTELLPAILTAALLAVLFVAGVLVRPWLIVPLIVLTTGLDSTGRLIGEAGKVKGIFHLTGFHLTFALMIIALAANICLSRRVRFPDFEIKVPVFLFLACIAVSLTYSPNQPEATVSFVRICALVLFA